MKKASLIVADSGPLITLAVADALDTLLLPHLRVIIPDMVRFEVVRDIDKPCAQEVMQWIRSNEPDRVFVATTEVFDDFSIILNVKRDAKTKGRGEEAASEILSRELSHGQDVGILLFEDSDVRKDNFLVRLPDNVLVLSTSEYLFRLEDAKLLDSALDVIARATPFRGEKISDRHIKSTTGAEDIEEDFHTTFGAR